VVAAGKARDHLVTIHLMTSELSRLHSLLNSEPIIPDAAYRRSKVVYELVCYVNCLIGCVLSGRKEAMPIFIQRCHEFMSSHVLPEHENFYSVVRSYLAEVEYAFKLEKGHTNV
jgi:hypothetical protein